MLKVQPLVMPEPDKGVSTPIHWFGSAGTDVVDAQVLPSKKRLVADETLTSRICSVVALNAVPMSDVRSAGLKWGSPRPGVEMSESGGGVANVNLMWLLLFAWLPAAAFTVSVFQTASVDFTSTW